ncbi:MAG: nitroreductase family protein [Chloroflexi bacterium]|nr:nitroreductase family protein [Chloroflexota bacterium]
MHELIRSRRSIRRYEGRPVPAEIIERVLLAAVWAPSAHNRQPWRFVVITNDSIKSALASAMGERLRADRLADGDPPTRVDADVSRSRARITSSPAVIVLCLSMANMDSYPDTRRKKAEYTMAAQSTAMAAQNLLLAAHAEGLGACWMCAPLFCPDAVAAVLSLPADWEPQALITLGYPADDGKPASRNLPGAVTIWR